MKANIPNLPLATQTRVKLRLDITADVNITPLVARQHVNRFLLERTGNYLSAGEPELTVSARLYWRVPVIYALPGRGKLGQVGACLVDVQTGETQFAPDSASIEQMEKHAELLYSSTPPSARV